MSSDEIYNLAEAADLVGRTTGSFYTQKNREALQEYGASVGGAEGWAIPRSALIKIGWMNEDGTVNASRRGRPAAAVDPADADMTDPFVLVKLPPEVLAKEIGRLNSELLVARSENEQLRQTLDKVLAK
ncbi:hypothetical protein [Microbacterium sp. p3-SID336]|uniref:hypothetical protein n=1 Tax=Microbacterium sp. p3-SID336 TaxID=2916212 RepID=UPI0021A75278|nr:hypothetical protein [Microbacterium sp. p3-SID336]MCT1478690.1 hypothetical protein [Microbacterium sp. p3-SID336]